MGELAKQPSSSEDSSLVKVLCENQGASRKSWSARSFLPRPGFHPEEHDLLANQLEPVFESRRLGLVSIIQEDRASRGTHGRLATRTISRCCLRKWKGGKDMNRRIALFGVALLVLLTPVAAQAGRGYGRYSNVPPMTPFGPAIDPNMWRQAGGDPELYQHMMMQKMTIQQQQLFQKQMQQYQQYQKQLQQQKKSNPDQGTATGTTTPPRVYVNQPPSKKKKRRTTTTTTTTPKKAETPAATGSADSSKSPAKPAATTTAPTTTSSAKPKS
jgi:hypothetical protein